jgi:hypothetical protein
MFFFNRSHRWWLVLALLAALGLLSAPMFLPQAATAFSAAPSEQAVTAAWEQARAAGSYHFTSDVTQVILPVATLGNVGRTSRTEKFYLEGQNDLTAQTLEMTLWSQGGSVLQAESGLSIRTEGGKTFARQGGGDWEEIDDFTGVLAPQGDFLAYLAAIKEVQAHPAEERSGIKFTRYSFTIDSERFAVYMHKQMEAALRARGELPPTLNLEISPYFQQMVGSGELWVGEEGLPLRQILTLQFPEQNDEQVHAQIVVDFSGFGHGRPVVSSAQSSLISGWLGTDHLTLITDSFTPLAIVLPLLAGGALLLLYRRKRLVNVAIVSLVIFAQVVGPVLTTITNVRFIDAQSAKAATQEEAQAAAQDERDLRAALGTVEFNPHLNPLESGDLGGFEEIGTAPVEASLQSPTESPQSLNLQSSNLQSTTDTDLDGLTDFVENRIGTSTVISDTDSDGLLDAVEVNGFSFGGQTWYTNPDGADSNGDGQSDRPEWGMNSDGTPRSTPLDTDGDGLPDLFDDDNDGDGVPDNKDQSPYAKGAVAYTEAAPLQLTVNNLTTGKPTFVEFQVRPQNAAQLWYAFNVLDWPQDDQGQMRDVDGLTYANYASAQGRPADTSEINGDMKIVPMLEIRVPDNGANLPPQTDLTPFNISVNNFTNDGATKVAYVPLSIVTDEKTGMRVAFSGQMRYLPTGVWPSAHQVRLAWVVQALVDLPCDKTTDTSADCQADGYRNNVPQMIQSYYSDWTLASLTVREEHGTDLAILYEDPAIDDNKKDDKAIWALAYALEGHFLAPRNDNNDGRRDLTLADLPARFDRDNNPSAAQRMDVPNILQVEMRSYATLDEAMASTTMTETGRILNTVFQSHVDADRQIKPLLVFAQENRARLLSLNLATQPGNYVTQTSAALNLNLAPTPQSAQTVDVTAGLKWASYCAPAGGPVSLTPCSDEEYWTELERRYAALAPLPDDEPDWVGARLQYAQFYYSGLRSGYYANVQVGSDLISPLYSVENESGTAASVRAALQGAAAVPLLAAQTFHRLFPGFVPGSPPAIQKKVTLGYGALLRKTLTDQRTQLATETVTQLGVQRKLLPHEIARLKQELKNTKFFLRYYRVSIAGVAGAVLMVATQIASLVPDLPLAARGALGGLPPRSTWALM